MSEIMFMNKKPPLIVFIFIFVGYLTIFLIFKSLCVEPNWTYVGKVKDYTIIDGGLLGSKYYLVDIGNNKKYEIPYTGPSSFPGELSIGDNIYYSKRIGWKRSE